MFYVIDLAHAHAIDTALTLASGNTVDRFAYYFERCPLCSSKSMWRTPDEECCEQGSKLKKLIEAVRDHFIQIGASVAPFSF